VKRIAERDGKKIVEEYADKLTKEILKYLYDLLEGLNLMNSR